MEVRPIQIALPLDEPSTPVPPPSQPVHDQQPERRSLIGRSSIEYIQARSILTESSGFMDGYDYTLNPYSGCSFGCTYCYAAFFVRDETQRDTWGQWVRVKENALALLQRRRHKSLATKMIYMSSVTDPYQPIERDLELTRSILEELVTYHQPRLVIQTRSPIVKRDIDLLQQFEVVQVNMTVTTDDETVRRTFEPSCASITTRLEAIRRVHEAGIATCITMTPLLPVADAHAFAQRLVETGVPKFIVQPFHLDKGRFVAGTRDEAKRLFKERRWNMAAYQEVLSVIKQYIPHIGEGKDGFAPV